MRPQRVIASISFSEEGAVAITWMDVSTDVRNGGLLVASHQLLVNPGDGGKDYGDEIDAVRDAALGLLDDALEDFATTEAVNVDDQ